VNLTHYRFGQLLHRYQLIGIKRINWTLLEMMHIDYKNKAKSIKSNHEYV